MEESTKIKKDKIQKNFQSMAYGENSEKMQEALDWLKCKEHFFSYVDKPNEQPNGAPLKLLNIINNEVISTIYIPEIDSIKKILAKTGDKKWTELDSLEKTKILYKIGTEIEKNVNLFAQLEILTRGILSKESKNKALPLLSQYFKYYSVFAYTANDETRKPKPLGTAVGIISNESYLPYLGLFLAPALAAGCNVILQIGSRLAPVAFLLQDITKSAGLPDGTFKIIPSDDGELLPYLSSQLVDVVTLFADLNNDKYRGINTLNKKILVLTSYKTPVMIFDSADLDSALENVIETSWGYQGLLPWTTDTILVQENILEAFVSKLKLKLKSLKIAPANDKLADISSSSNKSSLESLNKIIGEAKRQGIEVFQPENNNKWQPTLLIGGKVEIDNALRSNENNAGAVTILAFRSIDEAVNLANNSRQGLWATVWSDNIGVVNEVSRKLKVSNIYVNSSHGLISPDVVISPTKESGVGNFGGKEGYLEYLNLEKNSLDHPITNNVSSKQAPNLEAIVTAAKKAQEKWQKTSKIQKQKIFQEFAELLLVHAKNAGCPEQTFLSSVLKHVYMAIKDSYNNNISSTVSGYHLTSVREPRGVIVIDKSENLNSQLILTSIFEGNSLILLTTEGGFESAFKSLSLTLPSGVLNLVPYNPAFVSKLAANKQVCLYVGNDSDKVFSCLPLRDSKTYMGVSNVKEDLYGKIDYVKNVWSDIGKSSTCNF